MGRRSRKRSISETASPVARTGGATGTRATSAVAGDAAPRPRLGSEERNAELRAKLTPLEPGEHPRPLVISVVVALLLAIGNLALWGAGFEIQGEKPEFGQIIPFAALMLIAAWGMWTQRYWAVLGFQSLLAITIVVFALFLMAASNVWAALLCLVVIGFGGWLFWALVRVLGRMKVPRPGGLS